MEVRPVSVSVEGGGRVEEVMAERVIFIFKVVNTEVGNKVYNLFEAEASEPQPVLMSD